MEFLIFIIKAIPFIICIFSMVVIIGELMSNYTNYPLICVLCLAFAIGVSCIIYY